MAEDENSPNQGTLLVHWRQLAGTWPDLLRLLAGGTFRLSTEFPSFVQLPEAAPPHRAPATDQAAVTEQPPFTSTPDCSEPEALRPSAPPLRRIPRPRRLAAPAGLQRRRSSL